MSTQKNISSILQVQLLYLLGMSSETRNHRSNSRFSKLLKLLDYSNYPPQPDSLDVEDIEQNLSVLPNESKKKILQSILSSWCIRGSIQSARDLALFYYKRHANRHTHPSCPTANNLWHVLVGEGFSLSEFDIPQLSINELIALTHIAFYYAEHNDALTLMQSIIEQNDNDQRALKQVLNILKTAQTPNERHFTRRLIRLIKTSLKQEQDPQTLLQWSGMLINMGYHEQASTLLRIIAPKLEIFKTTSQKILWLKLACQARLFRLIIDHYPAFLLQRSAQPTPEARLYLAVAFSFDNTTPLPKWPSNGIAGPWNLYAQGQAAKATEEILEQIAKAPTNIHLTTLWFFAGFFSRESLQFAPATDYFKKAILITEQLNNMGMISHRHWVYYFDYATLLIATGQIHAAKETLRHGCEHRNGCLTPCKLLLDFIACTSSRLQQQRLAIDFERTARASCRPWLYHDVLLSIPAIYLYHSVGKHASMNRMIIFLASRLTATETHTDNALPTLNSDEISLSALSQHLLSIVSGHFNSAFLYEWIQSIFKNQNLYHA